MASSKNIWMQGVKPIIVCPLVEANGESGLKPATDYEKLLEERYFKGYRVGLLHGKMKSKEKEEAHHPI